jgi:hypothetical protein
MRYQSRQWMGVALATLFLLAGATARVRAEVPVPGTLQATLTTTKGCGTNVTYNVGDSFQILLQTNMNATGTLTIQRPDGTFTLFSNVALNGNTQYFLNRTVAAADAASAVCGARTLTLTVNAGSGATAQTFSATCVYNVACANVGGAIAANVTTDKGCGAGATYNAGATVQIFLQVGQTANATLTDIWPDNSQHIIFQNTPLQAGIQYFVTGGLSTTGLPSGTHTLAFHVVSPSNSALTGDATCQFTIGQVAGAIAADVHTDKGCGANATYTNGQSITVFVMAGQTALGTLTETLPGSSTPVTIFQNVTLQAGVQYFVTGTAGPPAGQRTLSLHLVSTTNSALTGDATCTFSVSGTVAGTVTADLHTNKGCNTGSTTIHFAQGEANTIFFTVGRNAIVSVTVQRPDGTFTILSNFAATAGVQYFINSSIAGINGNRTLTLNATATDGTGDTGQATCSYTVP